MGRCRSLKNRPELICKTPFRRQHYRRKKEVRAIKGLNEQAEGGSFLRGNVHLSGQDERYRCAAQLPSTYALEKQEPTVCLRKSGKGRKKAGGKSSGAL